MRTRILLSLLFLPTVFVFGQEADRPRLHAQPPASKGTQTGLPVGAQIPAFELTDQNGTKQSFDQLRGPNGMLLVFFRSADWCPYCKTQLVDLNAQVASYTHQGLSIVGVSYDTVAILKNFSDRQKIGFKLLADQGSKTIRAFGILNTTVQAGDPVYGIPFPGMYRVDAQGVITAKYFEDDYMERYSAAAVLTHETTATGADKRTVDNKHFTMSYSASDSTFSPGRRIALVLELQMKPKMHLYAPGVKGYIPVDWKMADSTAYVSFAPEYPESKMLNLPVIHETVPVFDGKIRIVRDITIGNDREIAAALGPDRTLTVQGTFRYQACDDKACYIPATVPLKWNFKIGSMDTQRAPTEIRVRP